MEKVPQIVRERLGVATSFANHPDADVLTAFAERSLPDRERASVLEHLSRCGDCREVVALALPESAPVSVQVAGSRSGWLTWPVLRWGFALAGVAVIGSLGVVQYQRRAAPMMAKKAVVTFPAEAKNESTAPAAAQDRAKEAPPAAAGKQVDKGRISLFLNSDAKKSVTALKKPERDEAVVAGSAASGGSGAIVGRSFGSLTHGPKVAFQNQSNQQANSANAFVTMAPSATPSAPPTPQQAQSQFAVNSRIPAQTQAVKVEAAPEIGAPKLDLENQPISTAANDGYGEARIEKTKPAGTIIGPSKVLAGAAPAENGIFDHLSGSPRWAITAHGTLQRSFDQGTSWQDVTVTGGPVGGTAMLMTSEAASAARTSALAKRKDAAKQGAASEPPIIFRAVAALGQEVWAGGIAGQLYHSTDAGSHWVQVVPSSGKATLAGDIVSLEFSDSQHGRVTTSIPEVWLTTDGGQSWQKQ